LATDEIAVEGQPIKDLVKESWIAASHLEREQQQRLGIGCNTVDAARRCSGVARIPVYTDAVVRFVASLTIVATCTLLSTASGQRASRLAAPDRLDTAIVDPGAFGGVVAEQAFRRVRSTGAGYARLILRWSQVAPPGAQKPPGFDAADPRSPNYRWSDFDRQVLLSTSAGLRPIVSVEAAPRWAERMTVGSPGTRSPDPSEVALFARAAARRYSGSFDGLPRVQMWMLWNEPNLDIFLSPQFEGADAVSPELYRDMLNSFSDAVHSVRADNIVVAGGLAPFGRPLSPRASFVGVSPLQFMRELLCMSGRAKPRPSCTTTARFDIWSHHPYTAGGPTKQAFNPDDVSLGDLPEMRRLLEAAVAAGHVVSRRQIRFWVTEFSWDSNPPDPNGVPARLHARWVAEAMYRMWQSGVSLVTWFQLRDDPLDRSRMQSGLYLNSGAALGADRPKLALTAFRFPFVAFPSRGRAFVWGRTPRSRAGSVVVEQLVGRKWRRVAVLKANAFGVFTGRVGVRGRGSLRARAEGAASLPFSLVRPPDFALATPFGD